MIVKFLPNKKGGGLGSIDYLLNERKTDGTARILKGNESQTRAIIKEIPYKQKTTFGVLSFSEQADSISDETKQEIIKDFERHLLGDFMKDRVNILWVEHSDKNGRLELNFVIPKIDLESGKSFNPYFDKRDRTNINLWKRTINDEYGFTSPDDPSNQYNQNRHKATLEQHNTITELDNTLKELVAQGAIKNRSHMIELLQQHGYEVTRQPKSSISVVLPNQKKPFRLKGGIYSAEFTDLDGLSKLGESQSRRIEQYNNRDTQQECIANRARLEKFIHKRDEYNKERYKNRPKRDDTNITKHQSRDNAPSHAENNRASIQWHSINNSNDIFNSRIFSQFLVQPHGNRILPSGEQQITSREQNTKRVANSNELPLHTTARNNKKDGTLSISTAKNSNTEQGRQSISTTELWGTITDDTARNRIIERNREIAERNSKIAERDRKQAERERATKRRLREIAERENNSVLQRLSREFQARIREYIINAQERIKQKREQARRIRERAERDRADQNRFKQSFTDLLNNGLQHTRKRLQDFTSGLRNIRERLSNFAKRVINDKNDTQNELKGYGARVSTSIQHTKSRAIERNGEQFSSEVESTAKRIATTGGFEIKRELQQPHRQRLVELTREKIRQMHRHIMRPY